MVQVRVGRTTRRGNLFFLPGRWRELGLRPVCALTTLCALVMALVPGARAADWPTYRGNPARTADVNESLSLPLVQHWSYTDSHAPRPAWPTSKRMTFDHAIDPVVVGDRVIFGSSVDGSVCALDAATGQIAWRYCTEGPIRFAPALWRDWAYVASDDGFLYALRIDDGSVAWKLRGGPDQTFVLGNERMISKWPMRGGPVVVDGTVYCAAGIWPSDGIYLYALNAETGEVQWCNVDSGDIYMPQPHGGANAKSGVAAQGYLVVAGDRLFVPTGRAVPAAFNRHTGSLEYFHLQKYGHNGESLAMVLDDVLFNGGLGFQTEGGQRLSQVGRGPIAARGSGVVLAADGKVAEYHWQEETKPDRKGKEVTVRSLQPAWSAAIPGDSQVVISVGPHLVIGVPEGVQVFEPAQQKVVWQAQTDGVPLDLACANGQLLVSTDRGVIHCFAPPSSSPAAMKVNMPDIVLSDALSDSSALAESILQRTGVTRGYCLDLGCGDGSLARELALRSELQIIAVDPSPQNVQGAQARLFSDKLLGARVTVLQRELDETGLPDYFADLIVSQRSAHEALAEGVQSEAARLQRPYGGQICWSKDGQLQVDQRGELAGSGEWTHQYADPSNCVNSGDSLVKGRLSVLWYRDLDFAVPSRHGRAPSPLMSSGRLFHEGMDGVVAVDAYNGRELWRYDIPNVLKAYNGDELMGVSGTGSNFCVGGDSLYVRDGNRCLRLDAAQGTLVSEYHTPLAVGAEVSTEPAPWGYIAWADGILIGSTANPEHVVTYRYVNRGGDMSKQLTESTALFAIDTQTGETLWQYQASDSIRHNAIALAGGKLYLIDRPLALFDREKKPKSTEHPTGKLVALDARSGEVLWQRDHDIYGTMLAVSQPHQVLLMTYQPTRFQLDSELGGWMSAFHAKTGDLLWQITGKYASRPTINDRTIYVQGGAWDLLTGEMVPFEFKRSYGCGILASAQNMLLFRSATLGYYDLSGSNTTENYGGIRPGCWINALPAGGLVLMPDATAGCECSYLNKAWIALQPE